MIRRIVIAATLCSTVAGALSAQVRQQSPEERARAQALLQAQTSDLYNKSDLPPEKERLRLFMAIMRDTLTATDATIERLLRAQRGGGSGAVVNATTTALRTDCARTLRTVSALRDRVKPLRTTDPVGDKALDAYRVALDDVHRDADDCGRTTAATDRAKIATSAEQLSKSIDRYTAATKSLMSVLEIPFLPRNYADPLGG